MSGATAAVPEQVRARIVERAATLDERIAASLPDVSGRTVDLASLRPWVQAYAAGDEQAYLRRLAWDGLDAERACAAVLGPLRLDPSPKWFEWVERFAAAASDRSPRRLPAPPAVAFVELWLPIARATREELARRAGAELGALSPAGWDALERRLLQEVATIAEQAALEWFRAGCAEPPPDAEERREAYDAFVARMLAGGELVRFLEEHAVVARLFATLGETFVEAGLELAGRLAADAAALQALYGASGEVASIDAAMGDRHHGGRRVMVLRFASGARVVYKPRPVGLEQAFSGLVEWARGQGADLPPGLRVLARDGYGWVEFARAGEFSELAQVRRYFRRAGGLLCLAHLLRGRDLHMENVVATPEGPQLVDTEMLLQPETAAEAEAEVAAGTSVQDTCLGSGLLSLLQGDGQGGWFDIGGLRGSGSGRPPIARRVWRGLGTDAIGFVREPRFEPAAGNRVLLDGVLQRPEDHAGDVAEGFQRTYRVLLAGRAALLAEDSPLAGFSGQEVRVLLRTSTQYGALQYVLTAPQYQRSGLRRSFAMDSLNRRFARERERPAAWPLVADERRALEQLDIPRFTLDSGATAPRSASGEAASGWFARAGFASVTARVRAMDEADLALQAECLAAALACPVATIFESAPPPATEPGDAAMLLEHARWIGRELLLHARATATGPRWPTPPYAGSRAGMGPLRLYDGDAGPALFLAALSAVTGEPEWRSAAREACSATAARAAELAPALAADEPIGAASGVASVAYALGLASRLLGDRELLQAALDTAGLIDAARIAADRRLDVVGGAAGAALALAALHELCEEGWLLERAVRCADHLEAAAVRTDDGTAAWPASDGRLLAGMGHGAAGIAYALARVAARSGERRLVEPARAGCAYERALYSPAESNWPVLDRAGGRAAAMAAWCHGAPGIGLARVLSLPALDEPWLRDDVEAALSTTLEAAPHGSDHLCCGRLGRADALLTAGLALEREPWLEAARACALQVAARAGRERRFTLPASEFECRPRHPGFFRGLAGVGYQLLRVAAPAQLPTVLGWQVRAAEVAP